MRDATPPVTIATWTGPYLGVQGGANAPGTKSGGFDAGGLDGNSALNNYSLSYPMTQTSVGAFAGYDYQINRVLVGIEGDYNRVFGSNHSFNAEDQYPGFSGITKVNAQWNASVRGRLGFLPTDRMLVYGTAGVAFAAFDLRYGIEGTQVPLFGDVNVAGDNRIGWTAGAGMQYAFDTSWSMRGEYRYTDYRTNRVNYDHIGASYVDTQMTENRASVGIAYKFAGPVTAKY